MFEITVESEFCAAHALEISGTREPLHGHNWRVTATVTGPTLDGDGLLCDFHTVAEVLEDILGTFHNRNLNETAPFDRVNPSAEHVARHIAEELGARINETLSVHGARVSSVRVTEAARCAATYRPPHSPRPALAGARAPELPGGTR